MPIETRSWSFTAALTPHTSIIASSDPMLESASRDTPGRLDSNVGNAVES